MLLCRKDCKYVLFTGPIPATIGNCTELQELIIFSNITFTTVNVPTGSVVTANLPRDRWRQAKDSWARLKDKDILSVECVFLFACHVHVLCVHRSDGLIYCLKGNTYQKKVDVMGYAEQLNQVPGVLLVHMWRVEFLLVSGPHVGEQVKSKIVCLIWSEIVCLMWPGLFDVTWP